MSVSIYAGNFNKDNNVKETSINYKENVSNRTNGINGIFNGVVMSEGQDNSRLADNTYESLLKEADDVKQQIMNSASTALPRSSALPANTINESASTSSLLIRISSLTRLDLSYHFI